MQITDKEVEAALDAAVAAAMDAPTPGVRSQKAALLLSKALTKDLANAPDTVTLAALDATRFMIGDATETFRTDPPYADLTAQKMAWTTAALINGAIIGGLVARTALLENTLWAMMEKLCPEEVAAAKARVGISVGAS